MFTLAMIILIILLLSGGKSTPSTLYRTKRMPGNTITPKQSLITATGNLKKS